MAKKKDGLNAKQRALKQKQQQISNAQIKKIEAEQKAAQKAADKGALKVFEERCKERQVKREERQKRTEELRQLAFKKRQIAKKYQ